MKKCRECGAWADVLETRQRAQYVYRAYKCANDHRYFTREFLWDATSKDDILKRLNAAQNLAKSRTKASIERGYL